MPFQFVPAYVENMATAALEYLPGCTLVNVVALGSYSAYEYTFAKDGYEPVSKRLGYDFGLPLPEDQRGRALAQQFVGLFVDTAKVRVLNRLGEMAQEANVAINDLAKEETKFDPRDDVTIGGDWAERPVVTKSRRNKGGK